LFTFLSQLRETLQHGHPLHLSTIFVGTVWILWAVKVPLSRRYRPPASVGIPVVDKPLELFREVLRRIGEQTPDETIVVINGPRNPALEDVCNEFAGQLTWTGRMWRASAKPRVPWPSCSSRSPTPRMGGVTTKQRILRP
jgi:hyaluronan synthase